MSGSEAPQTEKIEKTDEEWRAQLSPEQYRVLRGKGTEAAFCGALYHNEAEGIYRCAGCGAELFRSGAKFHSHCGWPSFFEPVSPSAVATELDTSHGMRRVEVTCARCGGHLGHVFPDGPAPTGLRYCMNSISMSFEPGK